MLRYLVGLSINGHSLLHLLVKIRQIIFLKLKFELLHISTGFRVTLAWSTVYYVGETWLTLENRNYVGLKDRDVVSVETSRSRDGLETY